MAKFQQQQPIDLTAELICMIKGRRESEPGTSTDFSAPCLEAPKLIRVFQTHVLTLADKEIGVWKIEDDLSCSLDGTISMETEDRKKWKVTAGYKVKNAPLEICTTRGAGSEEKTYYDAYIAAKTSEIFTVQKFRHDSGIIIIPLEGKIEEIKPQITLIYIHELRTLKHIGQIVIPFYPKDPFSHKAMTISCNQDASRCYATLTVQWEKEKRHPVEELLLPKPDKLKTKLGPETFFYEIEITRHKTGLVTRNEMTWNPQRELLNLSAIPRRDPPSTVNGVRVLARPKLVGMNCSVYHATALLWDPSNKKSRQFLAYEELDFLSSDIFPKETNIRGLLWSNCEGTTGVTSPSPAAQAICAVESAKGFGMVYIKAKDKVFYAPIQSGVSPGLLQEMEFSNKINWMNEAVMTVISKGTPCAILARYNDDMKRPEVEILNFGFDFVF